LKSIFSRFSLKFVVLVCGENEIIFLLFSFAFTGF